MKTEKLHWIRPALRILSRSKPEEVVLFFCKKVDVGAGGPGGGNNCKEGGSGFWCSKEGVS